MDSIPGLPLPTVESVAWGLALFGTGLLVGWLARRLVTRLLAWRGRSPSAAQMFGGLAQWTIGLLTFAAAITVVFPSVKPVNALGGIGILSIAAGIAFQTVLGNMFAGILILARDVVNVGDQISVAEVAGTITAIHLSQTTVRTFDGRLVLIPNSVVHSHVVTIKTGYEHNRSTVSLYLPQDVDLDRAQEVVETAMSGLDVVLPDPRSDALFRNLEGGALQMDLRFWSGSTQLETRYAQHQVIKTVLAALRDNEIPLAADALVIEAGRSLRQSLTDVD